MTIFSRIGAFLRKRTPKIYKFLTKRLIFLIQKLFTRNSIYIVDSKGGSFKEFIADNNMKQELDSLLINLDDYSTKTVHILYQRLLNYPEQKFGINIKIEKRTLIGGFLEEEKIAFNRAKILNTNRYKLRKEFIESSVFHFYHGLIFLPDQIIKYIANNDFIDLGAYVGESALALSKYNYKKIYSIEMSQISIHNYKKTMTNNLVPEAKYKILNYAISNENGEFLKFSDSGSSGLTVLGSGSSKDSEIEVPLRTLDYIVNKYEIKPRFIKMDVEGEAMNCLQGGVDSIIKYRPVLSIAIYHNPIEFFRVKPFLESVLNDYTFVIRKLNNSIKGSDCHSETVLLAYPNNL